MEIIEIWESGNSVALSESQSIVDGEHIIARASGEAFFPDSASRNNRFYPREAWTNALKDESLQTRLGKRLVFGSVGHDQPLDDVAVREGKISHIVNRIYIDESTGKGMAEFLILNTPSGRTLNTLLRAGSAISVSTRARGEYLEAKNDAGQNVIDPSKFALDSVDFVLDPGFLDAKPSLVEEIEREKTKASLTEETVKELLLSDSPSAVLEDGHAEIPAVAPATIEKTESTMTTTTENTVDATVLDALKSELSDVQASRNEALEMLEAQREELATAHADREALEARIAEYAKHGSEREVAESLKTAIEALESYTAFGAVEELSEKLAKVEAYESLGEAVEIEKALTQSREFFETHGAPAHIIESLEQLEQFAVIGTPADITEALEAFDALIEELGTPAEIREALEAFESLVADAGTPSEIRAALMQSENFFTALRVEQQTALAHDVSDRTHLKLEAVVEMLNAGKSVDDILGMFDLGEDADDAVEAEVEEAVELEEPVEAVEVEVEDAVEAVELEDAVEAVDVVELDAEVVAEESEESDAEDESDDEDSEEDGSDEEDESDEDDDDAEDSEAEEAYDTHAVEESVLVEDATLTERLAERFRTHNAASLMEGNRYNVFHEARVECPVPSTRGADVSRAAKLMK